MAETTLQQASTVAPRYAPGVESIVRSHQYIRKHRALIYWKISPYYLSQRNDSSCSLATATMIINAARSNKELDTNQPLATQNDLLYRVKNKQWDEGVRSGGEGITLEQLSTIIVKALQKYGLYHFTIEIIHPKIGSKESELLLHKTLVENEQSGQTFMIANFNQKFFTNGLSVGHFAPVGAYDLQTKRVLIMDPDRQLYEPYWVPEKLFLESMATYDKNIKSSRGYLLVKLNP